MADGVNKGVLIAIVLVAIIVWFLFNKAQSTVKGINQSVKQTYTTGTTVNAVATSVAPALGQFLSGLLSPSTPKYSQSDYTPSYYTGDGLLAPSYANPDNSSAYTLDTADGSFDFADPFAGTIFGNL